MSKLRREEIYDALLDDETLEQLPGKMAAAYGARSCVLHWWHPGGLDETVAMNGYYTAEQMADYSINFAAHDLWSLRALEPHRVNRALNGDDFVPPEEYERSVFYNEWIRAMGDDTFHCLGMVVKTDYGTGFVGLHRGKGQGCFPREAERKLEANVRDLRRMLALRGRLAAARRKSDQLTHSLDALGTAMLQVDADGRLLHANAVAWELLDKKDGLFLLAGKVRTANGSFTDLQALLALATDPAGGQAGAMLVPRRDRCSFALTMVPLRMQDGRRGGLLTIELPESADTNLPLRLRQLYGLSPAEAEIAIGLAHGRSLADMADARQVALGTVRQQVKCIAEKMDCRGQVDIVRMICSLTRLFLP